MSCTYGVGRFTLFKAVVSAQDCRELAVLLEQEKVAEFNQRRREAPFAGKYLDLSGLRLVGKDLPKSDLSKCILAGCNFSGSDLRGSSFQDSYVAQTTFYWPFRLEDFPTAKMARRTNLEDAHFEDATLEATYYGTVDFGYAKLRTGPSILAYCKRDNATGLPDCPLPYDFPTPDRPIELTPGGVRIAGGIQAAGATNILFVSGPCENPIGAIPETAREAWKALGVDVQRIVAMRAVKVDGQKIALHTDRIFNGDPNVVVVLGERLSAMGLVSAGPVVVEDEFHPPWYVVTDSVLWFRHRAVVPVIYVGHPVVAGPYVRSGLDKALLSPVFREPGHGISGDWIRAVAPR
jgi:hypothetical protein